MSRYHSYINTAITLLSEYDGKTPLAYFLKEFFRQAKKYGANDRKQITHLCYTYFRLGKAFTELDIQDRILLALFLISGSPNSILEALRPEWNEAVQSSPEDKLSIAGLTLAPADLFPWINELSSLDDANAFAFSHLVQPGLFLRSRPGMENAVEKKLSNAHIAFGKLRPGSYELANAEKVQNVITIDREAVVQDDSSQRIGEFMTFARSKDINTQTEIWDCCAASGGKSILATDILKNISLTVTDIRESIIHNLHKRFTAAGIRSYNAHVADLTKPIPELKDKQFDLVLADVPCTGSGTWSRTPEQLFYFDVNEIENYASRQQMIVSNVCSHIRKDGYLLYTTCSVFKKENEDIVDFIIKNYGLHVITMKMIEGYNRKADTMFAALLQRD